MIITVAQNAPSKPWNDIWSRERKTLNLNHNLTGMGFVRLFLSRQATRVALPVTEPGFGKIIFLAVEGTGL